MYQNVVEQVQSLIKQEQNEMHTAIPGNIMSFDVETGRATVQPKGKLRVDDETYVDYPQLNDIPIVFPSCPTMSAGIAFPIMEGDSCLIIFCEQALDFWLESGDTTSELRYSLTNAVAIPGLLKASGNVVKEACSENSLVLHCGQSKISISADKIKIVGNVEVSGDLSVSGTIDSDEEV